MHPAENLRADEDAADDLDDDRWEDAPGTSSASSGAATAITATISSPTKFNETT